MPTDHNDNILDTTQRSLDIVEFIQDQNGATMADITAELDLVKSTTYKHLQTLRHNGYVVKEGEQYHIGLKFYNLGGYARSRKKQHKLAIETTRELANETREEVDMVVENDGRGLILEESYHPEHRYAASDGGMGNQEYHSGTYYHLHCTASGKALLATMSKERVNEIVDRWGLPRRTENTITSKTELFDELKDIKQRGFAYSDEEAVEGLRAVGHRVKGVSGNTICAISLFGPSYRMTDTRFRKEIPKILRSSVETLEEKILNEMTSEY
ncbi:IclR family transcriptional regulator [Halopenitus persicus]|uniref:Transcriptional regulator, IclR family n=1 Tax=Halopenitus persicus TaxID=1048396 RepID=A0A1H3E9B3_9EURY|nr:IclR family transcriptional regulator [Halopenitus persicus]SDX74479.1 transcriptional regulator, IclR family [Halopenitus persicus]